MPKFEETADIVAYLQIFERQCEKVKIKETENSPSSPFAYRLFTNYFTRNGGQIRRILICKEDAAPKIQIEC